MSEELNGYYSRFDPAKNYEEHRFRAGYVLQSAELNEIQQNSAYRMKTMGDALFKDGDVVRDALVVIGEGGVVTCESGAIYLSGMVRGVPAATITIPTAGSVAIGIYLIEKTITEDDDPALLDPATGQRNYNEPGAARLQITPAWGYQGDPDATGEFFPIYYADDGVLRAKEAPPTLDSVTQAIARYDVDSNGSNYIISGLRVTMMPDAAGSQVYNVQDGRARVSGFGVNLSASRRLVYPAVPDLRSIDGEPHVSATTGAQRVNLDRTPINTISQVRITAQKTVSVTHGTFAGATDPLPDTSILDILSVNQGGTTYIKGTDYKLTAGKVDWSLPGAEPAPGSTYSVTYQYITSVEPTAVDNTGFTVTGAVAGKLIEVNYTAKLPRIDRLCLDASGAFVWVVGVATDFDPVRPQVPNNMLALCQVLQTWDSRRTVVNDGVKMVPMSDIEGLSTRLDTLTDLISRQMLVADVGVRDASAKKGLFVDPFLSDEQRDQGLAQTAAIVNGALMLPIAGGPQSPSTDVTQVETCDFVHEVILEQTSRTGGMQINPYMAYDIFPSKVTLTPAVDRWVETQTIWASPVTEIFQQVVYAPWSFNVFVNGQTLHGQNITTGVSTTTQILSTTTRDLEFLRQISVSFRIAGFGPGEQLTSVTFDGIAVTASAP